MSRLRVVLVLGIVAVVTDASASPASSAPATEPPTQQCGDEIQQDFDPGLESRMVIAGPVTMVAFRVSPVPSGTSPARNFKVQVRLDAGATATLRTKTPETSLLFDRDGAREDNIYRLDDGTKSVRFVGCEDRSAVFIGVVLTNGPRTLDVVVKSPGTRKTRVTLTAYEE